MTKKGFVFIMDVVIALIMSTLLINLITTNTDYKNYERIMTSQQINDLLLTSQQLDLTENEVIENANKLFKNRKVEITINNKTTTINEKTKGFEKISNSIKYINSSNKEIYIEVIIFY
jgi:hypothetical protein